MNTQDEKKILKAENTTSKSFNYSLGKITFNITLSTSTKQELKDFLEILARAKEDVEATLAEIK